MTSSVSAAVCLEVGSTVRAQVTPAKLAISEFPVDLHNELLKLDLDRDGYLDAKEIEVAMRVLLNERRGRISVKAFDPKLESELKELGSDEDGYLGFRQIEEALLSLLENKKRVRQMKWALIFLLVAGLIFLAAMFGLVYAVVDLTKDMRSMNGVLVDRVTGKPLQTGSSIYTLDDNGALMPKEPKSTSKARRSRREWAPGDGTAVKTSILTISYELDSSWYAGQLQSLRALMTSKYGGFMSTNIHGLVIVRNHTSSEGNSSDDNSPIVVFETGLGRMVLQGTVLSRAEGDYKTMDLLDLYQSLPAAPPAGSRRRSCTQTEYPLNTCCACANYDTCVGSDGAVCVCDSSCGFF